MSLQTKPGWILQYLDRAHLVFITYLNTLNQSINGRKTKIKISPPVEIWKPQHFAFSSSAFTITSAFVSPQFSCLWGNKSNTFSKTLIFREIKFPLQIGQCLTRAWQLLQTVWPLRQCFTGTFRQSQQTGQLTTSRSLHHNSWCSCSVSSSWKNRKHTNVFSYVNYKKHYVGPKLMSLQNHK